MISSLEEKCEIITSLRKFTVNLVSLNIKNYIEKQMFTIDCGINKLLFQQCVKHGFGSGSKKHSPFLGQVPASDLSDMFPALTTLVSELVTSGLTTHSHNLLLMYTALDFYEEVCRLGSRSSVPLLTVPPPALIYGGLASKSCAILSRVCGLLLR